MSLVELLVSMMVFAVLSTLLVGLVSTVSRAFTLDRAATDSTRIAATAMNELSRVVRSGTQIPIVNSQDLAPVFLVAAPKSFAIRTYVNADSSNPMPTVVRFEVTSAGELVEQRWKASPASGPHFWTFAGLPAAPFQVSSAYWTNPASTRILARGISPLAVAGVSTFRYCTESGEELVPAAAGLNSSTEIPLVSSVAVRLSVQADVTGRADPAVLLNYIGIPNLGDSREDFC